MVLALYMVIEELFGRLVTVVGLRPKEGTGPSPTFARMRSAPLVGFV